MCEWNGYITEGEVDALERQNADLLAALRHVREHGSGMWKEELKRQVDAAITSARGETVRECCGPKVSRYPWRCRVCGAEWKWNPISNTFSKRGY